MVAGPTAAVTMGSMADRRPSGTTLHLVPVEVWEAQRPSGSYRPEGFEAEGFIHCTDGEDALLVPANAFYRADPRPFLVLEIDVDRLSAPVRYDDTACRYPHIYGPLNTDAVVSERRADRGPDGTFIAFPAR